MSILSDGEIRSARVQGLLSINPYVPDQLQPASYDLRLGSEIRIFNNHEVSYIDPREAQSLTTLVRIGEGGHFVIHPSEFILGSTVESVGFDSCLVGQINGKSSLGRLGLMVHATAGFFDPGFHGTATLELSNVSKLPIRLYPGMLIAQMVFLWLGKPAEMPYGSPGLKSKYQGQSGPTASRVLGDGGILP